VCRAANRERRDLDGLYLYTASERKARPQMAVPDGVRHRLQTIAVSWPVVVHGRSGLTSAKPGMQTNDFAPTDRVLCATGGRPVTRTPGTTGEANAVSPDNLMRWDSRTARPGLSSASVYGHSGGNLLLPPEPRRWPIIAGSGPTKGTPHRTVPAQCDVTRRERCLVGSGQPRLCRRRRRDGFEFTARAGAITQCRARGSG